MTVLRTAIIGYGKMGQIREKAAEAAGGFEVVKFYDGYFTGESRLPRASSIDEILSDPAIDAVFICTTNNLNKPLAIRALESGKHVFCEKPPAFNAAGVEEIRATEARSGKVLMYGFNHRQHGAVIKMREEIDGGSFGHIIWMRGRYGKSVDADYLKTWRANREQAGGGILLDQGIHMLDLFLYLSGAPFDEVSAMVSSLYWNTPGIEDNVFALMRNRSTGVTCSLHSTMTQWRHLFSLEVFLQRGYMVLNGLKTSTMSYGEEELFVAKNRATAPAATWEDEERFHFNEDTSWQREAELFRHYIQSGEPVKFGASADALEVMRLIDTIYATGHHQGGALYGDLH